MADKGIGVAGHRERLDDFIIVPACGGKVLGGPGLRVSNTLGQNFVDGGGDAVHVRGDSVAVVEHGLTGRSAAGESAENQSWQHQHKQYREKKDYCHRCQQFFPMLPRRQCQPCGGSVGPAHCGAFGGGGDGLAGFDGAVYGVGGACGLLQAAFFIVVQVRHLDFDRVLW